MGNKSQGPDHQDRKLSIAVAKSRCSSKWKNTSMHWNDLVQKLTTTTRTKETAADYAAFPKAQRDQIKDVGGFVGGKLEGGRRKREFVTARSLITLDADHADDQLISDAMTTLKCAFVIYSTHSHTAEAMRLRIVIPLSRDVSVDEYAAISQKLVEQLGMSKFDPASYRAEQLMYWPSTSSDGEFYHLTMGEAFLDPDEVLSAYADWRDRTSWPAAALLESETIEKANRAKVQQDPTQKPGVIGAFCRAHSIVDAIEKWLPDRYEAVREDRYTYTGGSTTGGMIVYEDVFSYSHHATDPSGSRLCNAFDLVRLHLFTPGTMSEEGKTISEKDSFDLMKKLAAEDPDTRVQLTLDQNAQTADEYCLSDDIPKELEWMRSLQYDKNGKLVSNIPNLLVIMQNDPHLKGIVYNEFADALEIREDIAPVPWKHEKGVWRPVDDKKCITYIETHYGHFSVEHIDIALSTVADDRSYHPLREYLRNLPEWDRVPRVDTLFIDYFGTPDNEYVRAVTRKTLCAAVRRVMEPGIKFDTMPVLVGPQGRGKSTLIARLGMQWFSDSLSLFDTRDKTGPEKMQNYWILEIGEMTGMKKMDVEILRSFLSRQNDIYRAAFGKRAAPHKRQCIFIGTSNAQDGFLRDVTGNRRFWPIEAPGTGKKNSWEMTQAEVDQIWAEVKQIVAQGEPLYLDPRMEQTAQAVQNGAMQSDDREGLVREYLDRLLPENWEDMSTFERRQFLHGEDGLLDLHDGEGTVQRTTVSAMEIWAECFEKDPGMMTRRDSNEIIMILTRLGWERSDCNNNSLKRRKPYGTQRCFDRPVQGTEAGLSSDP